MGPFPCSFQRSKPRQIFTMSVFESYWANKAACDDAERAYYEKLSGCKVDGLVSASGSSEDMALVKKLNALEVENKQLKKVTDDLKALVLSLFGSSDEEESEEKKRITEERLKAYHEKKA